MEIEFYGANCFRVKTKKTSLVFDDNLKSLGAKSITKDKEVLLYTNKALESEDAVQKARLTLDSPGEFEVGDISVQGVQARAHMDEESQATATVFQCMFANTTVTVLGHVHPEVSAEVLELIGGSDVLILPVGGNGYTLDAVGATSVVKKVEPGVVIASQFEDNSLKFEVPAAPLDEFVKTSALTAAEPADSYKTDKPNAELASQTHIVVLNKK